MGRRILASLLAMALIFALPVFSLADGEEVILMDSGSPEASTFSLRESASVMSTRAVTLPSAPEGFEWIEVDTSDFEFRGSATNAKEYQIYGDLMPGTYFTSLTLSQNYYRLGVWNTEDGYRIASDEINYSSSEGSVEFSLDSAVRILFYGYFDKGENVSNVSVVDFQLYELKYIPSSGSGVSSGYTYGSGIISGTTRSIFETFSPSFGVLPAGKYLINIYHWGDAYDVRFQISNIGESIYYPTSTSGGVTTFIYEHGGGSMQIDGSFTVSNIDTSVIDGSVDFNGIQGALGDLDAQKPLSWVFNITDVIAIPLEGASDSDFGIFSLIVGFLRNQFEDMKSFLAQQFDKDEESYTGATSPELSQDINSASSMIDQEQQFMESINTQITDQSSNVDPVTVLDGIEGSSNVFSSMLWVSSIVSSGIDGMGVFQFLIYVPMILGVVTLVIGRGASLAGRRPRPQPVNVRKGK